MSSLSWRINIFVGKIEKLVSQLRKMKTEMVAFQGKCAAVNLLGTLASCVGFIGMAFIPAAGFVAGITSRYAASAFGGVAANLLVDQYNVDETKLCIAKIKRLLGDFAIELTSMQPVIDYIARVFEGSEEETAVLKSTRANIDLTFQNMNRIPDRVHPVSSLESLYEILNSADIAQLLSSLRQSNNGQIAEIIQTIRKFSPSLSGHFTEGELVKVCAFLVSFITLARSMVQLRSCLREHVTVEMINEIIPKLKSIQCDFLSILYQYEGIQHSGVIAQLSVIGAHN